MMPESHLNKPNIFIGGLNLDDDNHLIEATDMIDNLNIRNMMGAINGACTNVEGNVLIPNGLLPAGTNRVIGICEDKRETSVFFFVYNSNENHCIFRYYPTHTDTNPNGEIELVIRARALGFNEFWKVHSARFVDSKYLYWTDAYSEEDFIEGNPPYKINAVKANITGKQLEYELLAGLPNQGQFSTSPGDGNQVNIFVYDRATDALIAGIGILPATLATFVDDPYGFLSHLATQVNSSLSTYVTAEYCEECRVKFVMTGTDTYLEIEESNPPTPNKNILFVRTNHYPAPLRLEHLDVIKWPPRCEPDVTYVLDANSSYNNVNQIIVQFRHRFWYDDGEKSAWGPISLLALPIDKAGNFINGFNAIQVDFTDERLNDPDSLCIIRKVEIAYREGNLGAFRSVDILDICDIGINQQVYYFRNDKLYSLVPSDDVVTDGQNQSLKLFDAVPRITGALEIMSDRQGNNRLFYGANLENYDNPDCLDMEYTFEQDEDNDCFITIRGTVQVNKLSGQINDGYFRGHGGEGLGAENDTVLDGFVIYLAGTNHYGISKSFNVPTVPTPTGEFEITGVPKGRYIMRVAGFKCRYNEDFGPRYNLNNGIEWQRTSSPLIDCAGSLAATGLAYERVIDLTSSGLIFDLDTEVGYGPIIVQDLQVDAFSGPTPSLSVFEAYLVDNNGTDSDPEDKLIAINVERQKILFTVDISGGTINDERVTDHNGYVYYIWDTVTTGIGNVISNLRLEVADVCGVGPTRIIAGGGVNFYRGGWKTINDGNEVLDNNAVGNPSPGSSNTSNVTLVMTDSVFTQSNRTLINGSITDANGSGLAGVLVMYERNTRQEKSNSIGNYSIAVYCPWDSFARDDDDLIVTFEVDSCYLNPPDVPVQTPDISDFCTNPYDIDNPYTATTVVFPFVGALVQVARYLKAGGIYRAGVVYEDRAGRKATVLEGNVIKVPFHTERTSYVRLSMKWSINSQPPAWATHWRFVISKESYYRRYLDWLAEEVKYVIISEFNETPVDTTYSNGNATHILIKISAITVDGNDGNPVEWFFVGQNTQGFNAQPNDRIRFILDETGTLLSNDSILDFPILGVYRLGDDYYVVVEDIELFREVRANWLVELYTPKNNEEVVFYEIGECHEVLNPTLANRAHGGSLQNQVVGVQPAEGYLKGGDTYWRRKTFPVDNAVNFTYDVENSNITDFFESEFSDIGRANVRDDDFGERFYFNKIRLSGIYIPDSKINGLSAFRSIDVQSLDMRYGNIMKLISADDVMLAVCQFKTQPIYVAKDRIMDLSGASSVGRSDSILNLANELKYDFGTQHPETVIEQDGTVYAFDVYQGVVWRYSTNGQFPISNYKAQRYFNNLSKTLYPLDRKTNKVYGFYEREFNLYGLTFAPSEIFPNGLTILFSEEKNRWNNFASFVGEYYSAIIDRMVSFKDGGCWLHGGTGHLYNNFYGVQYPSRVKFVSNNAPRAVKNWWNLSIQADNQWYASDIIAPASYSYPSGMRSEIPPYQFSIEEGIWKGDFLRDKTDPDPSFNSIADPVEREITKLYEGRVLRGEILIIELELVNSSEFSILRRADVEHTLSMDTKA